MAQTILIKKTTTTAVPANASLQHGELAVNTVSGKLWVGDTAGNPVHLNAGDVTSIVAGASITISSSTGNVTINHADTSAVADVALTGNNFVQGVTFDTNGHVQTVTSGLVSITGALDPILDEFTGNGSATTFTRAASTVTENNTFVYLDGVYQAKSEYSTSGKDVILSEAPDSGVDVEIISLQANTTFGFDLAGDSGANSTISGGDTLTITGPDADILTTVVGDTLEIRVGTVDAGTY